MKNIILSLIILIVPLLTACGESGGSSGGSNPEPIIPEAPVRTKVKLNVRIESTGLSKESANWKYYSVYNGYDVYYSAPLSLRMAQLLGEAENASVADAYISLSDIRIKIIFKIYKNNNTIYTAVFACDFSNYACLDDQVRQDITDTIITWIKERPTERFSGDMYF